MSAVAKDLTGKVALVTGGSRGIGRAAAERLAAAGAHVAINYHSAADSAHDGAAAATRNAIAAHGVRSMVIEGDVSDPAAVAEIVAGVSEELGPIDIVINNAGIHGSYSLDELTPERWDRVLAVDLKAQYLVARAVRDSMRKRGGGRIVLISSELAMIGDAGVAAYCAAKAGVFGLTRALARELAPDGILVNCVAPGPTDTDLLRPEERTQEMLDSIPLGRLGDPAEVANSIAFMVGSGSTWITGQTLSPNGGVVM